MRWHFLEPGLDWCHSAWLGLFSWQKASWMLLLAFSCIIVCYVSRVRHSDLIYIEMVLKWYGASHYYCCLDITSKKSHPNSLKKSQRGACWSFQTLLHFWVSQTSTSSSPKVLFTLKVSHIIAFAAGGFCALLKRVLNFDVVVLLFYFFLLLIM